AKYADHLPLYRQEQIFGRAGVALPRSTLASWVGVCGVRLQPLVDALKAHVLNSAVVHADETPVAMLAPGTGKTHRAYLWAYATAVRERARGEAAGPRAAAERAKIARGADCAGAARLVGCAALTSPRRHGDRQGD